MKKIKTLNWVGFVIVLLLCSLAAMLNKNVNSITEWGLLTTLFGFPVATFFLIAGRKK